MTKKKTKPKRNMAAASLANLSPWQPGQSGSPVDRSPGPKKTRRGRNDLASDLADELARDFEKHGAKAIRDLRKASPASYIRACITMVPKESLVIVSPYEGMTDQDIRDRLASLMRQTTPAPAIQLEGTVLDETHGGIGGIVSEDEDIPED